MKLMGNDFWDYMRIRFCIDIREPLKRRKKIILSSHSSVYAHFHYERLFVFYFLCRLLGHLESFSRFV